MSKVKLILTFTVESAIFLVGQPSRQSSTFKSATSEKAVDGNTNGQYSDGSCMHTGKWRGEVATHSVACMGV